MPHAHCAHAMPEGHARVQVLAENVCRKEPPSERVSSAIRIHNLALGHALHGEHSGCVPAHRQDRRVWPTRDYDQTVPRPVYFGEAGDMLGDSDCRCGRRETDSDSPCDRVGVIAKNHVAIRKQALKLLKVKARDVRSREVQCVKLRPR